MDCTGSKTDPNSQKAHAQVVFQACECLRKKMLRGCPSQLVFQILRGKYEAQAGAIADTNPALRSRRLDRIQCRIQEFLALPAVTSEVGHAGPNLEKYGELVTSFALAQRSSRKIVFSILGLDSKTPPGEEQPVREPTAAVQQLVAAQSDLVVCKLIRREFEARREFDPNGSWREGELYYFIGKILEKINWKEKANTLATELEETSKAIVLAASAMGIRVPRIHSSYNLPWICAAAFLSIGSKSKLEDAKRSLSALLGGTIGFMVQSFLEDWLPELYPWQPPHFRSASNSAHPKSTSVLDKNLTMDNEFRESRPGSGTTRKLGSHRDNRGHN
jgi:hypothetical protein